MARVTVVNDNPEFLELLEDVLEDERHDTTAFAGDEPDLVETIGRSRPDLLIIDLRMGGEGSRGWELAREIRDLPGFASLPVLVCSADVRELGEIEERLARERSVETLAKPFGIDQLTDAVDRLLGESVGS